MDEAKLRALLADLQAGRAGVDEVMQRLRKLPYDSLEEYARLDVHRALRQGLPEAVLCEPKTPEQAAAILERLWQHHDRVMGTRVPPAMAQVILARLPEAHYDPVSRLVTLDRAPLPEPAEGAPYAMVLCGGTSDLPVAEEAAQTLAFLGHRVERAYDVGVAGLHRLVGALDPLMGAGVAITVAGMEGALTSVVAGLAACPVVGVPTSVGYGASFAGVAPLLTMLNSCALGVAVVNIDNGFGAGIYAHLILRQAKAKGS